MKKYNLVFLMLCIIFSCAKKKVDPVDSIPQSCLVSSFDDYVYTYNAGGNLISIENSLLRREFKYEGDKIFITQYLKPSLNKSYSTVTLDNGGRVTRLSILNYKDFNAKYNSDGYLSEIEQRDTYGGIVATSSLTYQNDNLTSIKTQLPNSTSIVLSISYSTIANNKNNGFYADFALAKAFDLNCAELIDRWGKRSKNLLNSVSYIYSQDSSYNSRDVWDFVLNDNKNVSKATFKSTSSTNSSERTFNFTYQCK